MAQVLGLGLSAGIVMADPPRALQVSAAHIPYYVETSGEGVLLDWFGNLTRDLPIDFHIEVFPPKRARLMWETRRVDVYMPMIDGRPEPGVLISEPLFHQNDHAFVRVGTEPVCSWEALAERHLKLGLTEGYAYPDGMQVVLGEDTGQTAEWVNGDDLNLRKLVAGRIDVFIGEYYSGLAMIREMRLEESVMVSPCPLARREVGIAMKDTQSNRLLMEELNRRIRERQSADSLEKRLRQFVMAELPSSAWAESGWGGTAHAVRHTP
ncbi:MAG: hypothetical protein D6758_12575 [Gammaproteobacteria bacterium]|nr:MAG: hypothetical protein D6758_12575 [Gammaproteobacteria bacterium]